jgi:hypothetical protein
MPAKKAVSSPIVSNPINSRGTFQVFRQTVSECTREQARAYVNSHAGFNEFHYLVDQPVEKRFETKLKIAYLMKNAKRLGLDPNEAYDATGQNHIADDVLWNNSPLGQCIAYENLDLIPFFLEKAREAGFEIDLDFKDRRGKTPLMFAIKLGWAPIEIIQLLMTKTNYNMPEDSGMTPTMLACALRRIDIVKLLIQEEANQLGLGEVDFSHLSFEQRAGLSSFIHQIHPESGKTLGHYAVMRSGTLSNQREKGIDYQETVINILKAADVDGFRDLNARYNALTNPARQPVSLEGYAGGLQVPTFIAHIATEDHSGKAYLSSHLNEDAIMRLPVREAGLEPHFTSLFGSFARKSMQCSILENTQQMIDFLNDLGLDFSIKQKNGKTVLQYIDGMKNPKFEVFITALDKQYLWTLKNIGTTSPGPSFFATQSQQGAAAAVISEETSALRSSNN